MGDGKKLVMPKDPEKQFVASALPYIQICRFCGRNEDDHAILTNPFNGMRYCPPDRPGDLPPRV